MVFYTLMRTALEGADAPADESKRSRTRFLPDNIYDAIRLFKSSKFVTEVLGEVVQTKFAELKQAQADRCPKALGALIKVPEIQFHHEVTNQYLWNRF
jgi:glutamine synthetase